MDTKTEKGEQLLTNIPQTSIQLPCDVPIPSQDTWHTCVLLPLHFQDNFIFP